MRCRGYLFCFVLGIVLNVITPAEAGKAPPRRTDPTINAITRDLTTLFMSWDLNKDGFLDKEELAKAFRGAAAKPYDYQPPPKDPGDSEKTDTTSKYSRPISSQVVALSCLPQPTLPSNLAIAGLLVDGPKKKTTKDKNGGTPPDYNTFPDYVFLISLDTNKDEKISKKEFDIWAKSYATQLKTLLDAQNRLLKAQQKLQNATTAQAVRAAQQELQREQREWNNMSRRMKSFEQHLQRAMRRR